MNSAIPSDHERGSRTGAAYLVWSASLEAPDKLATLFITGQASAALDQRVEMYFVGSAISLLQTASQASLVGYGPAPQPLAFHIAQTRAAGVRFYACTQALANLGVTREQLIEGVELGGVVQFASRSAERDWAALVF